MSSLYPKFGSSPIALGNWKKSLEKMLYYRQKKEIMGIWIWIICDHFEGI